MTPREDVRPGESRPDAQPPNHVSHLEDHIVTTETEPRGAQLLHRLAIELERQAGLPRPEGPGGAVVLVGPAGAGKTTYARAHWPETARISLDDGRRDTADDPAAMDATPGAVALQHLRLWLRLWHRRPVVLDSTNLRADVRISLLELLGEFGVPAEAVLFTAPLDVCLAQNRVRTRRVPEDVIQAHHTQLPTRETLLAEGFQTVRIVTPGSAR